MVKIAQQPDVTKAIEDRIFQRLKAWQEKYPNGVMLMDLVTTTSPEK